MSVTTLSLSEAAVKAPNGVTFRPPTGLIPWPFILLAGGEKAGKSWQAIQASTSPLTGWTYYIEVGEGDADQYGRIAGARYSIGEHDGSYRSILAACEAAVAMPRVDPDLPNLVILDSGTELWDLLSQEQQEVANKRRNSEEAPITMDQWNAAKKRWRRILNVLRNHDGPVIITARLEQVTVMDANGKPIANQKEWKIRAEKNLGFEVSGIVQLPTFGEAYLTGIRTPVLPMDPKEVKALPSDWSLDWLWRQLGLEDPANRGERTYVEPDAEAYARNAVDLPVAAQSIADRAAVAPDSGTVNELLAQAEDLDVVHLPVTVNGHAGRLGDFLRHRGSALSAAPEAPVEQAPVQSPVAAPAPTPAPTPAPAAPAAAPVAAPVAAPTAAPAPVATPAPVETVATAPAAPTAPATAPAGPVFSEPAPGETRPQKARRYFTDELGYQADVLGIDRAAYAGQAIEGGNLADLKPAAAQRFLVPAREQVIEALRTQGRVTEAEAYEGVGIAFPLNLAVVLGDQ